MLLHECTVDSDNYVLGENHVEIKILCYLEVNNIEIYSK